MGIVDQAHGLKVNQAVLAGRLIEPSPVLAEYLLVPQRAFDLMVQRFDVCLASQAALINDSVVPNIDAHLIGCLLDGLGPSGFFCSVLGDGCMGDQSEGPHREINRSDKNEQPRYGPDV